MEKGHLITAWQGGSLAPRSAFAGVGTDGATVCSVMLATAERLLSKTFLSWEAVPLLDVRLKRAGFCWGFFLFFFLFFLAAAASVGILGCQFLGYKREK